MQALRVLAVLAAFLAAWALIDRTASWLAYHGVPGSFGLHLFLLAWLVVWWLDLLSGPDGRTPWKPEREFVSGWRPWITLGGFALLAWVEHPKLAVLFQGGSIAWPGLNERLLVGVFLAPLVEEHAFRGVLWRAFSRCAPSKRPLPLALVGTSVAFSLWHLGLFSGAAPPATELRFGAPHFFFGVALGMLRFGFGGILPGILLHAVFNFLAA